MSGRPVARTLAALADRKRIALVELKPILSDLIAGIVENAGHEVVADVDDADLAIVPIDGETLAERHLDVLERRPLIKLLGLVDDGRTGLLWELVPQHELLGVISKSTLLDALERPDWRTSVAAR